MSSTESALEIQKLAENVNILKKDMDQVGRLVDRLDVTIEKLTEVSSSVSQLLAIQGHRLEFQEKYSEQLQKLVEKRREETEGNIRDLHNKIDKVERELQEDMDENNRDVIREIKEFKADSERQHKEVNEKMSRMERWMWVLMGGGIVVAWLINRVEISSFFS